VLNHTECLVPFSYNFVLLSNDADPLPIAHLQLYTVLQAFFG